MKNDLEKTNSESTKLRVYFEEKMNVYTYDKEICNN